VPFNEFCVDDKTVAEYSCTNNKLLSQNIICETGSFCKDGACVFCKDTDASNYEEKGFATDIDGKATEDDCYTFADGATALMEATCNADGKVTVIKKIASEYSAEKGKQYICNDGKLALATCTDSDNGYTSNKLGTVTDNFGTYTDSCTGTMLTEYACKDNKLDIKIIPNCKTCKDGVCTQ
jgi:hypothetical protein